MQGLRLESELVIDGGGLIGSQYDRTGNAHEIVRIDLASGQITRLMGGARRARFVAQNDAYLLYQREARLTAPLVLLDKTTGAVVKELGLASEIRQGWLQGNRLVAFQLGRTSPASTEIVEFELPGLRVVARRNIRNGPSVLRWRDQFIAIGNGITVHDASWAEIGELKVPARAPDARVICMPFSPVVAGDLLAVQVNCSHVVVYELATRALRYAIPLQGRFRKLAVVDGLLFAMPVEPDAEPDDARVFDLSTGRELARLPLNGNAMLAAGDRVVTAKLDGLTVSPIRIDAVDAKLLRDGAWRRDQVRRAFQNARGSDADAGIRLLDAAGIHGLESTADPELRPALETYGVWLSRTLDRFTEAADWLELLARQGPLSVDGRRALARAHYKRYVLLHDSGALGKAQVLARGLPAASVPARLPAHSTGWPVDLPGDVTGAPVITGDRVYLARWKCDDPEDKVTLEVLDRASWRQRQSVDIVPCDGDQEDAISSTREAGGFVFVSVGYREPDPKRTDLVVLRRSDLREVARLHAGLHLIETTVEGADSVLLCQCRSEATGAEPACSRIDTRRWLATEEPSAASANCAPQEDGFEYRSDTVEVLVEPGRAPRQLNFRRTGTAGGEWGRITPVGTPQVLGTEDPTVLLMHDGTFEAGRFLRITLSPWSMKPMFRLAGARGRTLVPAVYRNLLLVGYGRDLLVYDWKRGIVLAYEADLIAPEPQDNGHGVDLMRIVKLHVDRGRLVAVTFGGAKSRLLELEPYRQAIEGGEDWFDRLPQ